jgi:hypothetical protein
MRAPTGAPVVSSTPTRRPNTKEAAKLVTGASGFRQGTLQVVKHAAYGSAARSNTAGMYQRARGVLIPMLTS